MSSSFIEGPFHAKITSIGVCAWIGGVEIPTLWPSGYQLATDPIRLLNGQGDVLARTGAHVSFLAGYFPTGDTTVNCGTPDMGTEVAVTSQILNVERG
jgi:hypothetical protein